MIGGVQMYKLLFNYLIKFYLFLILFYTALMNLIQYLSLLAVANVIPFIFPKQIFLPFF